MRACAYQRLNNNLLDKRWIFLRRLGAIATMLWTASVSNAAPMDLQVHGFASQAFILTSDNHFFGDSDDGGSFDFRELGINASLRPLPNLQLSAQILSRRAGESDDGDIDLDYAFADYSFVSSTANLLGLRAGRIKNPFGLYNDTRDVAFTRPSILLPQSIYFDRVRDVALSADSAQVYGEHRTETGVLGFQLGVIRPRVSDDESKLALLGNVPGELDAETSYIGRLLYERDGGRLRLALSAIDLNIGYDPAGAADPLESGSIGFSPLFFSAQYNAERWSLTAEYARRPFEYRDFGVIPDMSFTGESYYVQGTYRLSPHWEALLRYDVLYTDKDDRDGEEFAAANPGRPAHSRFAKDLTIGLGWNISSSILLRAEYHNVDGTGWLPIPDNPNLSVTREQWDMYLLQGSFRF